MGAHLTVGRVVLSVSGDPTLHGLTDQSDCILSVMGKLKGKHGT